MSAAADSPLAFGNRLWIYLAERFPLGKTSLLVLVFSASMAFAASALAGQSPPSLGQLGLAFLVSLLVFFVLRIADEFKDAEADRRYRPERPVPRGLIKLRTLGLLAVAAVVVSLVAAAVQGGVALAALVGVWVWAGLMTVEFFVARALKARPAAYLASHMLIMPLIVTFIVLCLVPIKQLSLGLASLLALSLANGCILEIGRKLWAPDDERAGVESYSKTWGIRCSSLVWSSAVLIAAAASAGVGSQLGYAGLSVIVMSLAAGFALVAAALFAFRPTRASQSGLEAASVLFVLISYGFVGMSSYFALVGTS